MANTLNLGTDGNWATKEGSLLGYNSQNNNYKPLPFNFSRASKSTRVNKDGLIEEVGSGQPRVDYKDDSKGALKLEPSRTNLITQSEAFDNSYWTKSGASVTSGFTSPDGTNNAYKLVEGTNNGNHQIYSGFFSGSSGNDYTTSFFVKAAERTWCRIMNYGGATVFFDLANGVIGAESNASGKIEALSNGWYKISSTYVSQSNERAYLHIAESNNTNSYQGNGTSGIYVFGAQAEQGSYSTSYIATSGSSVTRVADVCNNGGNEQVINSTEGVLYAEIAAFDDISSLKMITLQSADNNNKVSIGYANATDKVRVIIRANGSNVVNQNFTVSNLTDFNKLAFKYESGASSIYLNGSEVLDLSSANFTFSQELSKLNFDGGNTANPFYGKTKALAVYKEALTDAELAALTQV